VVACPFLFPFECRRQYFYSTSFGIARALQVINLSKIGVDVVFFILCFIMVFNGVLFGVFSVVFIQLVTFFPS
jgi:hypothetical protein